MHAADDPAGVVADRPPEKQSVIFHLSLVEVEKTIERLNLRIEERFPRSGLGRICRQLGGIAARAGATSAWLQRPLYAFRALAAFLSLVLLSGTVYAIASFESETGRLGLADVIQMTEAAINELILIGAGIFFLVTLEKRIKRSRALKAIHELRSVAHVIDMHQLTKDPERVAEQNYSQTPASPFHSMTSFQLRRYLDYCSELLSLTAKIAAVYAQDFDDATVLSAVGEVESMTTDLSRKIWQKIMIVHSFDERSPGGPAGG